MIGYRDQLKDMTYQKIFELKFKAAVPTCELRKRYPKEQKKISRIALLDIPTSILRELIKKEQEFKKLISLKRWLFKKESGTRGKK